MNRSPAHPEDRYQPELAATQISRKTATLMNWSFVVIICSVPVLQTVFELASGVTLSAAAVTRPLQLAATEIESGHWKNAWSAIAVYGGREYFKNFEHNLERSSRPKAFFQPQLQDKLTAWAGFGNHQVILGSKGWLFYQPGVDYVSGPGILESGQLKATAKRLVDKEGETDPSPDPRPALLQLNKDLRKLGIRLVIFPAPDKATLQSDKLTDAAPAGVHAPLNNSDYARFLTELRANGVEVFDAIPKEVRSGEVRYLMQDTHWSPGFMESSAQGLARHLGLVPSPTPYHVQELAVSRVGDLVDMLKLSKGQDLFRPQAVTVHQILDQNGAAWQPDANAEILLLGDSYVNIYSQAAMGWGTSAGFAEHLSYESGRSLDVIAQNGNGALGVRTEIARIANTEHLQSKKIVIYEFAARELLGHNWRVTPVVPSVIVPRTMPKQEAPVVLAPHGPVRPVTQVQPVKSPASEPTSPVTDLIVVGEISKSSRVPMPGTAPYADCLVLMKMRVDHVESGVYEKPEILVAFLGMKNNVWTPAAEYKVRDKVRIRLIPLKKTEETIRTMQRADETEDLTLQPYYATEEKLLE